MEAPVESEFTVQVDGATVRVVRVDAEGEAVTVATAEVAGEPGAFVASLRFDPTVAPAQFCDKDGTPIPIIIGGTTRDAVDADVAQVAQAALGMSDSGGGDGDG